MKLLHRVAAIVSLTILAAGVIQLWRLGLNGPGLSSFIAASVSAFCLSLTLQVFALRDRIVVLEKQVPASQ